MYQASSCVLAVPRTGREFAARLDRSRCSYVPATTSRGTNSSPAEIACRSTGKLLLNGAALDRLQALRDGLGKPLIVRSVYRSPEHNRAVGGAKRSKHIEGAASTSPCQISAAADVIAIPRIPETPQTELELRRFGDLVAVRNPDRYLGVISGRANYRTRSLIAFWQDRGLRSPLLVVAYKSNDPEPNQRPLMGAIPVKNDLWSRYETRDGSLRMFAADFTRIAPGSTITETQVEPIGSYVNYGTMRTADQ